MSPIIYMDENYVLLHIFLEIDAVFSKFCIDAQNISWKIVHLSSLHLKFKGV